MGVVVFAKVQGLVKSESPRTQSFAPSFNKKPSHINAKKIRNSGIQTYQIVTNDDEVCIPSLSSILLAVTNLQKSFLICSVAHIGRKKNYVLIVNGVASVLLITSIFNL